MATDGDGDDELYGDLDDATMAKQTKKSHNATIISTTSMMSAHHTMPTTMMSSQSEEIMIIKQLQHQIKSLQAENDTLKKNIGILYRTAKSELERKDGTIGRLQDEVDSLRR